MRLRGRGIAREVQFEILLGLAQHRVLSTRQLHALYVPDCTLRWTESLLVALEGKGLVARAEHRITGRWLAWYLTERGVELADSLDDGRPEARLLTPEQAEGPLQAHTLAVNEIGLAFVQSARQRTGHECGPLAWRHEVWHWLEAPRGHDRGRGMRADAVLKYTVAKSLVQVHAAFLEVDRGTNEPQELAAQLGCYGQLYEAGSNWQPLYGGRFPRVLVLLDATHRSTREHLKARVSTVIAVARGDELLMRRVRKGDVRVYFTLLEHLQGRGPFNRIWAPLAAPERLVGWLEDEPAGLRVIPAQGEDDG